MEKKEKVPHINVDYFEDLTGDISSSASAQVADIGKRIQDLRKQKGLSLEELSQMTGFEVDLLSRIEQSQVQPQLGTVIKLSKALDSAFGRLVSGVGDRMYSITRKGDRKIVSRSTSAQGSKPAYTYHSLAPEVKGRHMEALIVQLEAASEPEVSIHEGEEFIYVLDGIVTLTIGEDRFELEPGDSAYYLSTTAHHVAAKQGRATIVAVIYEG
ncbi:MAG: XRE family transcriptional regulator [Desulfobacteraceae bacterium]|nr:XRE family transcriptional regulator [Desulfobacteraceae bacterium]